MVECGDEHFCGCAREKDCNWGWGNCSEFHVPRIPRIWLRRFRRTDVRHLVLSVCQLFGHHSLHVPWVVTTTTPSATSADRVGIMTTLGFQLMRSFAFISVVGEINYVAQLWRHWLSREGGLRETATVAVKLVASGWSRQSRAQNHHMMLDLLTNHCDLVQEWWVIIDSLKTQVLASL